eukprot:g11672.t1
MSILWRHKWKTFFAATIGIGAGIYYNRDYVIEKVSQGVQNYIKNMQAGMAEESKRKNVEEHFEKVQERCIEHTLQFLRAVREHISISLDVRPTLKLLKKATEEKDLKRKVVHWKTLLDLKLARVISGVLAVCILDTSFRVQFSILHREARKRAAKQAAAPMIEEIKEGDENQPKDGEEEENDISPETRAEFIERGWSSISADLDILAKNVLEATTIATEKAGWEGEKFKARVTDDEVLAVVDTIMDQLKDPNGSFIGYKVTDSSEQAPATRRGTMFASAEGSSLLISTMIDEAKHMMTSPMFTLGLTSSCDKGINALKQLIVDTIKAEAKVKKKTASKGSDVVKLFLAYIPKAMDRVRAGVFLQNMTDNQIINVLKAKDEEVDNFCAAVFEDEA